MKKLDYRLLLVINVTILFFSNTYAANINILTNPGFEDGTAPWTSRSCSITTVTSPVYSGARSARAYSRTAAWNGIQQDVLNKMVAGQTYQLSGRVRVSSSSATVKMSVQKTVDGTTTYANVASGTANNTGWIQISGNYTLSFSGNLTALAVYFEGPASGVDIYVDDANVYGPDPSQGFDSSASINIDTRYQVLEGFGAAGGWYEGNLFYYSEPTRTNLFNTLFGNLGLDIYRVRNTYGYDSDYINRSALIIQAANTSLGRPIRVMNSSWGPPAYLKSNDDHENGGTLKKDAYGNYRYADFAQWWRDSLTAWSNAGVNTYYLNMQNEPQWSADWVTCLWDPVENANRAGYKQGFAALYTNLNSMPNRPKLLAPESASLGGTAAYLNVFDSIDMSNVYGYAHHLYDGSADNPDQLIGAMTTFRNQYNDKPIFQTEYSSGPVDTWTNAMNLAMLMNNCLTVENVAAYVYWDLFWGSPSGLVSLTTPNYTINPVYYAFKHFSYFTDPNWQRVAASSDTSALRMSAFINPENNKLSNIIINVSPDSDITLTFDSFGNFDISSGSIYRSSSTENCVLVGSYSESVLLPKNSITTITLNGSLVPQNCAQVQNYGYSLLSDLNGDCSVNYKDLFIISEFWLRSDCDTYDNCDGSDFEPTDGTVNFSDFSDFAIQWMLCNIPGDSDCVQNW